MVKKTEIRDLTAKKLRRSARYSEPVLVGILAKIKQASDFGQTVYSMPKGTDRIAKELKSRGFFIRDTGMVWHITWKKDD